MKDEKRLKRKVLGSYMVSTVSIALVLFLLGSVGYIIYSAMGVARSIREGASVTIELRTDVEPQQRDSIRQIVAAQESVAQVDMILKEQKASDENFLELFGEDFESVLGANPLSDSFEVRLAGGDGEVSENLAKFTNSVEHIDGVSSVYYPEELIDELSSTIDKIQYGLLLFGGALLFVSLVLLSNTIRLAIYSRRYIINTMKLVGATKWFIMRPLLWDALKSGLLAGVMAAAMFLGGVYLLSGQLPEVVQLSDLSAVAIMAGSIVVLGALISVLFTLFSVNKFVNMRSNKIHIY